MDFVDFGEPQYDVPVVTFATADRLLIHYGNLECRSDRGPNNPDISMTATERELSKLTGVREVQLCRSSGETLRVDVCRQEGETYLRTGVWSGGDGHGVTAEAQMPRAWRDKDGLPVSILRQRKDGPDAVQVNEDARRLKYMIDMLGVA